MYWDRDEIKKIAKHIRQKCPHKEWFLLMMGSPDPGVDDELESCNFNFFVKNKKDKNDDPDDDIMVNVV